MKDRDRGQGLGSFFEARDSRFVYGCRKNLADTAVSGEDDDWGKCRLQGTVEVSEALDIEHVHLCGVGVI